MSFARRSASRSLLVLLGALAGALTGAADRRHEGRRHHRHAGDAVRLGGRRARGAARSPAAARPCALGTLVTVDTVWTTWLPAALVILLVVVARDLDPDPLDARSGLALYAIGSNRNAAYLAGVNVSAHADRRLRAERRVRRARRPRAHRRVRPRRPERRRIYTLNSVAAVVLGGVSLLGGVGGLVGPIAAAFVLTLVKTILILKGVDQNWAQVIQGALIVVVMMVGGSRSGRRGRPADERRRPQADRADGRGAERRTAVPRQPGRSCSRSSSSGCSSITDIVNRAQNGHAFLTPKQFSTTFLYAAVLGLIAAGQTLVMLTGGVDLSVATTATRGRVHGLARRRARRGRGDRDRRSSSGSRSGSSTGSASRSSASTR